MELARHADDFAGMHRQHCDTNEDASYKKAVSCLQLVNASVLMHMSFSISQCCA